MTRPEWKALYRAARADTQSPALSWRNSRNVARVRIDHGFTWFNLSVVREHGKPVSVTVQPAIIRDRSIQARIAAELEWARYFRTRRGPGFVGNPRDIDAARACVADARAIRLSASCFQKVTS